jgi:hypothetical protein
MTTRVLCLPGGDNALESWGIIRLTYHHTTDSVKGAPAESSESAGDGAPDEIEITSAMIEAGVKEFFANRDLEIATPESAVFAIFMAMIGESPALHSIPVVDRSE